MNLYEVNQIAYKQLPDIIDLEPYKEKIYEFLRKTLGRYYMLLNHEVHYFTVFDYVSGNSSSEILVEELMAIIKGLGSIKSIEITEQGIEFWVVDNTGECHMYMFFDYSEGVITI